MLTWLFNRKCIQFWVYVQISMILSRFSGRFDIICMSSRQFFSHIIYIITTFDSVFIFFFSINKNVRGGELYSGFVSRTLGRQNLNIRTQILYFQGADSKNKLLSRHSNLDLFEKIRIQSNHSPENFKLESISYYLLTMHPISARKTNFENFKSPVQIRSNEKTIEFLECSEPKLDALLISGSLWRSLRGFCWGFCLNFDM